jgi:hypothetical protein
MWPEWRGRKHDKRDRDGGKGLQGERERDVEEWEWAGCTKGKGRAGVEMDRMEDRVDMEKKNRSKRHRRATCMCGCAMYGQEDNSASDRVSLPSPISPSKRKRINPILTQHKLSPPPLAPQASTGTR